jgi:tetratricopeptide (TPR) repeat protein
MTGVPYVYGWLKKFSGSLLDTPATTLRDQVIYYIKCRKYTQAHQTIKYLDAVAEELANELRKPVDAGDIWAEIGLAFYQMGNLFESEKFWEKAVTSYPPESHEHAVVRWLLGSAQWLVETKNVDAMKNWKGAIREFENLIEESEKKNEISKKDWYSSRIDEMEESLNAELSKKFP